MGTASKIATLLRSIPLMPDILSIRRDYPDTHLPRFVLNAEGRRESLTAFRAIAAGIDRTKIEAMKARVGGVRGLASNKYLDLPVHICRAVANVHALGLDRGPPRAVLDLGTGAGLFPLACGDFGHMAVGLDLDEDPLYREMIALLKVDRVVWRIEPRQPLPRFARRFDVITAFQVLFDRLPDRRLWSTDDWAFFLDDLAANVLAPGGRFVMGLNTVFEGQHDQHERNLRFLLDRGAVRSPGEKLELRFA